MKTTTKRRLMVGLVAYLILWGLTWIAGEIQIDASFQNEFPSCTKAAFSDPLNQYPLERTKRIAEFDVTQGDGGLGDRYPDLPWKYRSKAIALAPFVLVDRCAFQTGGLCGWGGVRLHLWFFGLTHWWSVRSYWCS